MINHREMTEITGGVTETSLGVTTMRIWRDTQNDSTEEGDTKMINHSRKDMEAEGCQRVVQNKNTRRRMEVTRNEQKPLENKYGKQGLQCYKRGGWGHMWDKCPSRILFVQPPRMQTAVGREPWSISGKINGKQVDNMLLDTGAAITIVSEDVISKEAKNGNTVPLRGLRPGITMLELADVQLELGGGTIDLEVAVAPSAWYLDTPCTHWTGCTWNATRPSAAGCFTSAAAKKDKQT